jgi:hypothetical protein
MNDISPNAVFLSSAFEPSPDELRIFAHSEKQRSHPAQEKKPLLPSKSKPLPPQPASRLEIAELSSDEDLPDFSEILAGSKKEGAPESLRIPHCKV